VAGTRLQKLGGVSVGPLAPKRFQDPQIQSFWMIFGIINFCFFDGKSSFFTFTTNYIREKICLEDFYPSIYPP